MRIAVLAVVESLEVGGAERHLVQVLPRLDAARFQPSVFCLTHRGTLAGDPARRRAMGAAGQRRVSEHFSLDACVAAYERLYEGLLTAPGRPVQALIDGG